MNNKKKVNKVFPCSDDIRIFLESPIGKVVITKYSDSINDKVVIARPIVQYLQIFSSFLVSRLKACEINCKI